MLDVQFKKAIKYYIFIEHIPFVEIELVFIALHSVRCILYVCVCVRARIILVLFCNRTYEFGQHSSQV